MNKRSAYVQRFLSLTLLVLIAVVGLAFWQRNAVYDWWRLRNYQPSSVIAGLARDATMTSKAEHLFYVNHPSQQGRGNFSTYCPVGTEQSVVLGCYKSGQRGIYLLDIDKPELAGIEQVTAAHEMLHAAYERLSTSERTRVDGLLTDYYQNQLKDDEIKKNVDAYRKTEPNDVVNEMHSIFGTEIADLPPSLQTYYSQYFTNRTALTSYYGSYAAAFNNRKQQIARYDTQLNALKPQISQLQTSTDQQQTILRQRRSAIADQSRTEPESYNRAVDAYNASVSAYNADVRRLQLLVTQYNQLVTQRNTTALEERQLVQSLSAPQQTQ